MNSTQRIVVALMLSAALAACGNDGGGSGAGGGAANDTAAQISEDTATPDTATDAGAADAVSSDAGTPDTGMADAGSPDTGTADTGKVDAGPSDASPADTGTADTGTADTGTADSGAPDATSPDSGGGEAGTWFTTCGDPVCGGWKAKDGVPLCTTEKAGDPCGDQGVKCDPKSGCNALLVCADKDPKQGPGGCPISARRFKTGIHYLGESEEAGMRDALMRLPLATWRYKQGDGARRLGYILEDAPDLPATNRRREQVDVYSLATMAIAAVKAQQRELQALRAEVARLKASCPAR